MIEDLRNAVYYALLKEVLSQKKISSMYFTHLANLLKVNSYMDTLPKNRPKDYRTEGCGASDSVMHIQITQAIQ